MTQRNLQGTASSSGRRHNELDILRLRLDISCVNVAIGTHAGIVEIADFSISLSVRRHFQMSAFKVRGVPVLTSVQVKVRNTHRRGKLIFNEIRQTQNSHICLLLAGLPFCIDLPVDCQFRTSPCLIGVAVTHRNVGLAVIVSVEEIDDRLAVALNLEASIRLNICN